MSDFDYIGDQHYLNEHVAAHYGAITGRAYCFSSDETRQWYGASNKERRRMLRKKDDRGDYVLWSEVR